MIRLGSGCSGKTKWRSCTSTDWSITEWTIQQQDGLLDAIYCLMMMFTAAFKWCRFYLFLKKWKIKYFWNIVSVKANEGPAGLANDTCDVCMIPIICTCCRGWGFSSALVNCHKTAVGSDPSLVFLKLSVCIKQHGTCIAWLFVCRGILGKIML